MNGKPIFHSRSEKAAVSMAKQIPGNSRSKEKRARVQEGHTQQLINLLLALGACDSRLYPNVHRLLLVACTLPITSAEAERSFFSTEETEDVSKVYHDRGASCTPISYRHALQRPGTSRQSLYKIIQGDCSYSLWLKET